MSNQSEIERIRTAKTELIAEIEGKGVAVPDGEKIDKLPAYVRQIQTGTQLPALSNPASAAEIHEGYKAIDGSGSVLTGTFTLDTELAAQDSLITQIQTALVGKAAGSGGSSGGSQNSIEITVVTAPNNTCGYVDAETKTAVNATKLSSGAVIKPLGGALSVYGKQATYATCEYVVCYSRSGYYTHVFLSSGEVTF